MLLIKPNDINRSATSYLQNYMLFYITYQ